MTYADLTAAIDCLLARQDWVWIAIDGRCASGKSTLGAKLAEQYGANLFHMDDYYVPFARKTPERLAEPGGNADYERFRQEILNPARGTRLAWRRFDCVSQTLGETQLAEPTRLNIVEGSYSLHPTLRDFYDLKIFLTVDPKLQSERILRRNGAKKHEQFMKLWIPLEEAYFETLDIASLCDIVLNGENLHDSPTYAE